MANGTFSTANQPSDNLLITYAGDLSLVIPGTGEVKLQRHMNGGWRDVPDGVWTESTEDIVYSGSSLVPYRLFCVSISGGNILWELR